MLICSINTVNQMVKAVQFLNNLLNDLSGIDPELVEYVTQSIQIKPYYLFAYFLELQNQSPRKDYLKKCLSEQKDDDVQFYRNEIEEIQQQLDSKGKYQ